MWNKMPLLTYQTGKNVKLWEHMIRRLSNKYVSTITMENKLFMPIMILIYMSYNSLFCSQVYTLDNWLPTQLHKETRCSHLMVHLHHCDCFYGLLRSITTKDHHLYHLDHHPQSSLPLHNFPKYQVQ